MREGERGRVRGNERKVEKMRERERVSEGRRKRERREKRGARERKKRDELNYIEEKALKDFLKMK